MLLSRLQKPSQMISRKYKPGYRAYNYVSSTNNWRDLVISVIFVFLVCFGSHI